MLTGRNEPRRLAGGAVALTLVAALLPRTAVGGVSIAIDRFAPLSHTWDGSGDVLRSGVSCVVVTAGPNEREYRVRAEQSAASGGSFALAGAAAGELLPVALSFDSAPATGSLPLLPGAPYGGYYQGAYDSHCGNAVLTWTFLAADLEKLPAGEYSLLAQGLPSLLISVSWKFVEKRTAETAPAFRMTIPSLAKISGLDDLSVRHDGISDAPAVATDSFCVWSNTGLYQLRASAPVGDPARPAAFTVQKSDGHSIPFTLRVAGTPDPASGVPVANGGTVGPFAGNRLARDCAGVDNAALQVELLASDIKNASHGQYSTTVVLTVQAL